MPTSTPNLVDELQRLSLAPAGKCRAALETHAGDLRKALRALAASSELPPRAMANLVMKHTHVFEVIEARALLKVARGRHPEYRQKVLKASDERLEKARAMVVAALGGMPADPDIDLSPPAQLTFASPDVARLYKMCSADPKACEAALQTHTGDITAALRSMIVSGAATSDGLHPELVDDELYALAQVRATLLHHESMPQGTRKDLGINAASIKELRRQLAGEISLAPEMQSLGKITRGMQLRSVHPRTARQPKSVRPQRRTITTAPFPRLKLEAGEWTGSDTLSSWKGFQSRGGAYTSRSSRRPSTGKVQITVAAAHANPDPAPPTPEQSAAYQYLKDNQADVTDSVLKAILKAYPRIRKDYGFGDSDYLDDLYMPRIRSIDDLRKLIGLGIVHVLPIAKAGHAYIGLECGCSWDEEHGLGILLHKQRVVSVGQADAAFDSHAAKKDGGKPMSAPAT